ncbi:MAG TPA: glycerophosphodiester phosphodiesterase family protein, partial [Planctomycetota bacterium]|nr:glycerophosphodiester phosphodiesterase family protein [Planctomycetota bacterium]
MAPIILAHRGASALAPENTAAAFALARSMGADGFECDVHLSGDGVPVVIHDRNLKRLAGLNRRVDSLPWRQLSGLDVGSWFERRFSDQRLLRLQDA